MAFGKGVVVTGGYRSCPAVQCGATVTTALTAFVDNEHDATETYRSTESHTTSCLSVGQTQQI